jgi:hypothetical protein
MQPKEIANHMGFFSLGKITICCIWGYKPNSASYGYLYSITFSNQKAWIKVKSMLLIFFAHTISCGDEIGAKPAITPTNLYPIEII